MNATQAFVGSRPVWDKDQFSKSYSADEIRKMCFSSTERLLDLREKGINHDNIEGLIQAIRSQIIVNRINLKNNHITEDDFKRLLAATDKNGNIFEVKLSGNPITYEQVSQHLKHRKLTIYLGEEFKEGHPWIKKCCFI